MSDRSLSAADRDRAAGRQAGDRLRRRLRRGEPDAGPDALGLADLLRGEGQVSSLGTDLFLNLQSIFALAKSSGAKSDPSFVQAKPYLNALNYVVTGSGSSSDKAEFKAVLGLK